MSVFAPSLARPEDAAPPALALRDVSMRYPDGTEALGEVSFSVAAGEFVALLGPSGCGKSTLLKLASGLLTHTSGEIALDRESLGYTFQDATLMPWRRVLGNVELLMELRGIPADERRRRALEQIALVGLTGFEQTHPRQLSGGMKMRAALARALTLNPSLFLFDEPFGALDEITRERLNAELAALYLRNGFAALFVTHSIAEALWLSSRVLVMGPRPGRVIAEFTVPFDFPRQPDLRFDPAFTRLAAEVSAELREVVV